MNDNKLFMVARALLTCCALATPIACGEPSAQVRIDLRDLAAESAVTVDRLEQVRLIASAGTTLPSEERRKELELDLSGEELTFELELSAGPWLFELVGTEAGEGGSSDAGNATFYGDLAVSLEPRTDVELVIPLFPAGTLQVPVWIAKDTRITDALVTFVPLAPREDQSPSYLARLTAAEDERAPASVSTYEVVRVLPTGDYEAYVDATIDGLLYTRVEGEPVPIVGSTAGEPGIQQGAVNRWPVPVEIY